MADDRPNRKAGRRIRTRAGGRRRSGLIDEDFAQPGVAEAEADRRRRRGARRRILTATVIALGLIAGAVALTLLPDGDDAPTPPEVEPTTDEGASLLIVVEDEAGLAGSVALVSAQSGGSARIMLFPPALVTIIPGFGERPLGESLRLGGLELVELTVTNLLGVRVDGRVVHDATSLAEVISTELEVDLLDPFVVAAAGSEEVVIAEGEQVVEAAMAARLLVERGLDDQLTWLVRQGSVWDGLAAAIAADAGALQRLLGPVEGDPVLAEQALGNAAQSEELLVTAVPVQRVSVGDDEAYAFDADSPGDVVSGAFPYLALAEEPRVKVEVLSGNDAIGSTRPVAARLIRDGYRVLITDNATTNVVETEIIAQSREFQQAAVSVQRLLGTGAVFLNTDQPSGVVDLTIIVGSDLAGG